MPWRPLWGGVRARAVPASFPQILEETHPSPSPERWQLLCPQGVSLINVWVPPLPSRVRDVAPGPLCSRGRTGRALLEPPLPQSLWLWCPGSSQGAFTNSGMGETMWD